MKLQLDPWQQEFIDYSDNKILVSGRQTGKSEAAAIDNAEFVVNNKKVTALIISKTERQAEELLLKTLRYIGDNYKDKIKRGKDKPTKSRIQLKNGSRCLSLPVGLAGEGVRFLTCHKLTVDEAQLPPDEVFTAVTPMLLTTGGALSLLGTPQGKRGYFWECFKNQFGHFKIFHINTIDVINKRPITDTWPQWRKDAAEDWIEQEKARMSEKQFAQEYLGQFIEDLGRWFSDEIIKKACILPPSGYKTGTKRYLGVDIARMGRDDSTYQGLELRDNNKLYHRENHVTRKTYLTEVSSKILQLHKQNNYTKIGVDDGGIGVGVFDYLLQHPATKRKVVAINNRSRALDNEGKRQKKLLKEDLYNHFLGLLERGDLSLLDDDELRASLASVQFEYTLKHNEPITLQIFGNNTHIVEGLIRAAWFIREKHLNLWATSYSQI